MKNQVTALQEINAVLRARVAELEHHGAAEVQEHDETTAKLAAAEARVADLERRLSDVTGAWNRASDDRDAAESALASARAQLDAVRETATGWANSDGYQVERYGTAILDDLSTPAPVAAPYTCPRGLKRCWCSAENMCAEPTLVAAPCAGCAERDTAIAQYHALHEQDQRTVADLREAIEAAVEALEDADCESHQRALSALQAARSKP